MKGFLKAFLAFFLAMVILIGIAYAIDLNRMNEGKPVMFSTWGMDYSPNEETNNPNEDINNDISKKEEKPKEVTVPLYYADENIANLKAEKRTFANDENLAKSVVQAIIEGPKNTDLCSLIPGDTEINSVTISNGVCTLDLNDEFTNFTGGTSMENLAVFSLVNSLCEIDGISKVKINIDGNKKAMFGGHYSLEDEFSKDKSLVK